ncbi:arabinan endo-1,5-alpha-L-arabinosidase [Dysgonomonas sp. 216]|uniref:family 43 glycosylhydrolase n=1 Tax=Dysgonomonas sp. 216 TaxID=2302934 RepID=UPI0013D6F40D|nr:family 43 glycosylhydrolase [Dysgonomonas sp. 216]NDW17818.1 arabinan endo-1,5-alpha-L-arabinosidase [Dysgonomonas sp. 216]
MKKNFGLLFLFVALLSACNNPKQESVEDGDMVNIQNPIIPGYFADPSIVEHGGKFYIYATVDPWGANFLSCWESTDFVNWTFNKLNWPTKQECISPSSNNNMVWAPSVVKKDDKFYMYVSIGSEVWCGKADHPLGPWENILGDKPMISFDESRYYHVIDAEAFIDDDGKAYLYWGSGWDWKNGHCFAAELNDDMATFKTEKIEVTPNRYFEAPFMIKHNSKYYLTYSEGKTIDETYEVRYAVGDSPFGPFEEAPNSPILKTTDSLKVYGPGHHTMFSYSGKNYMLYHRHRLPFEREAAYRQICMNEFFFDETNSQIKNIVPINTLKFPNLTSEERVYVKPVSIFASSEKTVYTRAVNVLDGNYSTLWEAAKYDRDVQLTAEFAEAGQFNNISIRFEYPQRIYLVKIEVSSDNEDWRLAEDYTKDGISGSPVIVTVKDNTDVKYVRISFDAKGDERLAIWDISFY